MEHPAAVQRIEGVGIPSAAFVDRAVYIRTVRAGLSGEVVRQAIDAIGHRDFFVRLLGTTSGHLNRLYGRKSLGPARSEGLLDTLRTFAAATAAFGGLERARDWLGAALPALGGERPIDLCDTFEGRRAGAHSESRVRRIPLMRLYRTCTDLPRSRDESPARWQRTRLGIDTAAHFDGPGRPCAEVE